MRKKFVWWILGVLAVLLLGAALLGPIVSNVEQPKYRLVERSGNIEIRDYAPMIVAETKVTGDAARRSATAFASLPITSLAITPRQRKCR